MEISNLINFLAAAEPRTPLPLQGVDLIDKTKWILGKVAGKSVLHLGPTDSPATKRHAEEGCCYIPSFKVWHVN